MRSVLALTAILTTFATHGQTPKQFGQHESKDDNEPFAIGEFGGAINWNINGLSLSGGPSLAIEFTPIKDRLEVEFGATRSYSRGASELSVDLLFKKPYTISKTLEFMAGIGPEFTSIRSNGRAATEWGGEFALDFMYWPFKTRKFGFYIEPAYDYSFGAENEQSIGFSGGLLVGMK
ncbi:MAG TPA: hypothetical protein VMH27_21830 [Puia sp.]|nr:hypothetical protein [Puia sp.]